MNFKHKWELWELRLIGFALPWWFAGAPSLARWAWRLLHEAELPPAVSDWMWIPRALLIVGVVLALAAGSSDVAARKGTENVRIVAAMFLLGVCTLPLALFFT